VEDRPYLLVKCEPGLWPIDANAIMHAIARLRGVESVFLADVTGLPQERLDVITGVPTAAAVQRRVRRKVSLAG